MLHEEEEFCTFDTRALYAQHWLPQDAPRANLVVVHGLGEHSGRYEDFAAWFVPLGYAVHAFDHRGHGKSWGVRGHVNRWGEFREDVRVFLSKVQDRDPEVPTFLLGHSMGGLVVLNYVLYYAAGGPYAYGPGMPCHSEHSEEPNPLLDRLAGVVSSAPALALGEDVSPVLVPVTKFLSLVLPKLQLPNGLDAAGLSHDAEVVQAYREDPLVHGVITARFGAELARTMTWTMAHASAWPTDLPLLVVHGGADPICPPEASERFFVNTRADDKRRHVYPGYFHEVFNEVGREQVLQDVASWLHERLGQRPSPGTS
jgi:alpha-beta hydrolase superfamily lysophospholipase